MLFMSITIYVHYSILDQGGTGDERDPLKNQEDGEIIVINNERRDSGVGSSLTR